MATRNVDLGITGITDAVEIGRGGFAVVYRALQPKFRRSVAVKVLSVSATDEVARSRFDRECHAMGSLSEHPNIVTVYESGYTDSGQPYLVMATWSGGRWLTASLARSAFLRLTWSTSVSPWPRRSTPPTRPRPAPGREALQHPGVQLR